MKKNLFKVNFMGRDLKSAGSRGCFLFLFVSLVCFIPKTAFSQEYSSVLNQLLQEAASKNPQVKAAERRYEAARARVTQSWALADPMFGVSAGNLMIEDVETRVGPQMERYELSQEIPFPMKLYQKYRMARAEADAAQKEFEAVRREVARDVKKAYAQVCWVNSSIAVLNEVRDILQNVQSVAQARYASGKSGQRDVAKTQVELSMTYDRLYEFEQQRDSTLAELKRLLNRADKEELILTSTLTAPDLKRNLDALLAEALAKRPDIQQVRQVEKKQKEAVLLAGLSYAPDLKFQYEYIVTGAGETNEPDDGKDAKMVTLGFSVPLWIPKNQSMISESHQLWREAQEKLTEEKNKTQYEVKDAYARHTAAMRMVNLYTSSTLPQSKLALESDQSGYQAGTGDFLNLLDSERSYLDAKLNYLKAILDAVMTLADLERAIGTEFSKEEWGFK